jgi:hypothetical protein
MRCACGSVELVDGKLPRFHVCEYIALRNDLIARAEAIANARHGSHTSGSHSEQWTRCFSETMDRLAKGLLDNGTNENKEAA